MGNEKKPKTPEELAEKEVNKIIGKAYAKIDMKIREYNAAIKKLEKLKKKIADGDVVPNERVLDQIEDDDDSSSPIHITNILKNPRPRKSPSRYPYYVPPPIKYPPLKPQRPFYRTQCSR